MFHPQAICKFRGALFLFISLSPDLSHTENWKASNGFKNPQAKPKHKQNKNHNCISKISSHIQAVAQIQVSEILTGCLSLASGQAGFRTRGWHWGTGTRNLCWFLCVHRLPDIQMCINMCLTGILR